MTTATDYSALSDRELDALVAERVMGLRLARGIVLDDRGMPLMDIPSYSTTWEGAGLVLEEMRDRGWNYILQGHVAPYAAFWRPAEDMIEGTSMTDTHVPRAVCIAALRAIEAGGE